MTDYLTELSRWHTTDDAEMLAGHNKLLDELLFQMRKQYRPGTASSDVNAMLIERFWRIVRRASYDIEARLVAEGLRP